MLLVTEVTGPDRAEPGDSVTYWVSRFNRREAPPEEAAKVSWLVKATDGAALTHLPEHGPVLTLDVPAAWADREALVMPYLRSPSTRIAVRTVFEAAPGPLPVPADAVTVEVVREGSRYYASVDGAPRFYVGADVRYGARRGLMNLSNAPGPVYAPEDFEAEHGDWAWYLLPTLTCESRGLFTCLNTYDRAAFTFGAFQFAAHTPNDNFVLLLRELLRLPLAAAYFPDLTLARDHGGHERVHRRRRPGLEPLETSGSTEALKAYFNPTATEVDDLEAERAARMVDWCVRDATARELQIAFTVRHYRSKLKRHANKLPLNGLVDKLCLVVMDVLHQGRAKYVAIRRALAADHPFDALLALKAEQYRNRIATLRAAIRDLEAAGRVGRRVYSADENAFVEPEGA
jgi:hypothetical protein